MKESIRNMVNKIKSSKGIATAIVLCISAILLIACFFTYTSAYDNILPNVCIEGINIGGMSKKDAEEEIKAAFDYAEVPRDLCFTFGDDSKAINSRELKVSVDSKKTVENAFSVGRKGNLLYKSYKMFLSSFKKEDLSLSINFDKKLLDDIIIEMTKASEVQPAETTYALNGNRLTIIKGHGGKVVNRQTAYASLIEEILSPSDSVLELKLEEIEENHTDLESFYANLTSPKKNAEYRLVNGEVVIEKEKYGITVSKNAVKAALESSESETTIDVKAEAPEVLASQLEELLFRDTLGSYSSNFATSTAARAQNVILTAERINGKILMPGDVFSYDQTIGKRTIANGYREAGVYIGNKVESGIGGGICQTSSTLYSAALYSNLEIVSRTSHSLPVSYVPLGQDATIAEGYIDLKLKNNTPYPIKIQATVTGRTVTCSFLGVKNPDISVELVHTTTATYSPEAERVENPDIPKGYIYISNKGALGYAVSSQRIVKESGNIVKRENLVRSVYKAAPIIEEVNPSDIETPTGELKPYTPGMEIVEEDANPPEEVTENPQPPDAETPPEAESSEEPAEELPPAVQEEPEI